MVLVKRLSETGSRIAVVSLVTKNSLQWLSHSMTAAVTHASKSSSRVDADNVVSASILLHMKIDLRTS